MENDGFITKDN